MRKPLAMAALCAALILPATAAPAQALDADKVAADDLIVTYFQQGTCKQVDNWIPRNFHFDGVFFDGYNNDGIAGADDGNIKDPRTRSDAYNRAMAVFGSKDWGSKRRPQTKVQQKRVANAYADRRVYCGDVRDDRPANPLAGVTGGGKGGSSLSS